MASIIPRLCPSDAPPGEANVYHYFNMQNDTDGWHVLHGLDIAEHRTQIRGEADFVIIVPGKGVLVLEVKSHKMVKRNERGWWLGNSGDPEERGPFTQVSNAMHSIRDYLIGKNPEFSRVPFCSAVAFTHCNFDLKTMEWHPWQLINAAKLRGSNISKLVCHALDRSREHAVSRGRSWAMDAEGVPRPAECEAIVSTLRPMFELLRNPRAARKDMDDEMLNCTRQQFKALDAMSMNRRVIFCGPAGSGKTILAIEAARRFHKEGAGGQTLFLCYNTLLAAEISAVTKKIAPSVTVKTIDSMLLGIAPDHGFDSDKRDSSFWAEVLPTLAFDKLVQNNAPPKWENCIIDEAQDLLRPNYLDVLDCLIRGGLKDGCLMLFGDFDRQDIYARKVMAPRDFGEKWCPSIAAYRLSENCRNTKSISGHVESLGGLNPHYSNVLRGDDGHDPIFKFYNSPEDQLDQVLEFLGGIQSEGFSQRDVVLLTPTRESNCLKMLRASNLPESRIVDYDLSANGLRHCTIQGFKGLESPVVLIMDFESMSDDYMQSLLYIGISRAQHRLGIMFHDRLKKKIKELI